MSMWSDSLAHLTMAQGWIIFPVTCLRSWSTGASRRTGSRGGLRDTASAPAPALGAFNATISTFPSHTASYRMARQHLAQWGPAQCLGPLGPAIIYHK